MIKDESKLWVEAVFLLSMFLTSTPPASTATVFRPPPHVLTNNGTVEGSLHALTLVPTEPRLPMKAHIRPPTSPPLLVFCPQKIDWGLWLNILAQNMLAESIYISPFTQTSIEPSFEVLFLKLGFTRMDRRVMTSPVGEVTFSWHWNWFWFLQVVRVGVLSFICFHMESIFFLKDFPIYPTYSVGWSIILCLSATIPTGWLHHLYTFLVFVFFVFVFVFLFVFVLSASCMQRRRCAQSATTVTACCSLISLPAFHILIWNSFFCILVFFFAFVFVFVFVFVFWFVITLLQSHLCIYVCYSQFPLLRNSHLYAPSSSLGLAAKRSLSGCRVSDWIFIVSCHWQILICSFSTLAAASGQRLTRTRSPQSVTIPWAALRT